jgi:hypothetical protein
VPPGVQVAEQAARKQAALPPSPLRQVADAR